MANKYIKTGKEIECQTCKKLVYLMPYEIKSGRKKFCSRRCLYQGDSYTKLYIKGHPKSFFGVRIHTQETKDKIGESGKGKHTKGLAWNWIKDRTEVLEKHRLRSTREWKNWRGEVFERDKYTCRECGAMGVYLEPHHIFPIRSDRNKLFELTNGITLCRPCHQKTIWKESSYIERFSQLVVAH